MSLLSQEFRTEFIKFFSSFFGDGKEGGRLYESLFPETSRYNWNMGLVSLIVVQFIGDFKNFADHLSLHPSPKLLLDAHPDKPFTSTF